MDNKAKCVVLHYFFQYRASALIVTEKKKESQHVNHHHMDIGSYLEALECSLAHNETVQAEIRTARIASNRRHWFEMSEALLRALQFPEIQAIAFDLHANALLPARADLSPSTYAKLLYLTVFSQETLSDSAKILGILDGASASMVANGHSQGLHCVSCIRALVLMNVGSVLEAKRLLDVVATFVATLQTHELDPLLYALLSKARVQEYEIGTQYTKFYQTVFDVVHYCERSELHLLETEMSSLAYKTVIAALLSPETYNFGRLLMFAPFTERLKGSQDAWLLQWVQLCNDGDVEGFEAFCLANSQAIEAISDLSSSMSRLKTKVRLMALLHLVFYTPAEQRTFTFHALAQRCMLPVKDIEELVLQALSLKIIKGSLDGLEETVEVTWVQPRILNLVEIRELASRMGSWLSLVKDTTVKVTEMVNTIPQ